MALTAAAALSDEEVVKRVSAGDTALYEVVMRRYNNRLYRVARAILKKANVFATLAALKSCHTSIIN